MDMTFRAAGRSDGIGRRQVVIGLAAGFGVAGFGAIDKACAGYGALRPPVDVQARRALRGRAGPATACLPAPDPMRDIEIESYYTDRSYSVTDPARLERVKRQTRALSDFCWGTAKASDAWLARNPSVPGAAHCALARLDRWASEGALLGQMTTADSQHQRKWLLAGAALAYLKIQDAPGLDPAACRRVRDWFVRLAEASTAYYTGWFHDKPNNHVYWLGLALGALAVIDNDRARLDQAIVYFDGAMRDLGADGTLPLEMQRKGRAFHYHVFSLIPLVMIAEIGAVNGRDLYAGRDGALHRLAARVQAGLIDRRWFEEQTGAPQEWDETRDRSFGVAWSEPYYSRFPNPQLGELIAARRPIFHHWLGGNTTDDYGSPRLQFPS